MLLPALVAVDNAYAYLTPGPLGGASATWMRVGPRWKTSPCIVAHRLVGAPFPVLLAWPGCLVDLQRTLTVAFKG